AVSRRGPVSPAHVGPVRAHHRRASAEVGAAGLRTSGARPSGRRAGLSAFGVRRAGSRESPREGSLLATIARPCRTTLAATSTKGHDLAPLLLWIEPAGNPVWVLRALAERDRPEGHRTVALHPSF